ncbi:MAG: hypothetical protein QXH42_10150 [Thermoplasmata archaeon]
MSIIDKLLKIVEGGEGAVGDIVVQREERKGIVRSGDIAIKTYAPEYEMERRGDGLSGSAEDMTPLRLKNQGV